MAGYLMVGFVVTESLNLTTAILHSVTNAITASTDELRAARDAASTSNN